MPRAVLDKLAGMMGYSFPGEETAKFQAYSSIDQSYWNQKLEETEKLPIFDDGDNVDLRACCSQLCGQNDSSHVGLFDAVCRDVDAVTTTSNRPP